MVDYSSSAYWKERHREQTDTEWHCTYKTLHAVIAPHISKERCSVLVCGSGASTFPEELYDGGVNDVMVVDFNEEAVEELRTRNASGRSGLRIMQADIGDGLDLPTREVGFDLVVDKGTMDCILSKSGGYPRAVHAMQAIYSHMKTPATLVLVSHSPPQDRMDLFHSLYWHEIKVRVVRPPSIQDLVSGKHIEECLEDVPESAALFYEPGLSFVYSLVK
ncbi:S-adenosyl-L-methionine-dependent methyltransferase [Dunaliella salina]|uniref:S-adenosyl-L-methionine-dependent methyltransferase n=1 Tax=Dunaliella salina TaxID=3046 RepID=A0ABQ7GR82_DUNSA|nr:S-adenosyl-L-methionine-dependent methyltransferase [Dunaliella salina]|eukprot:KAF5837083.1 S-adenosyl-L-methionine-dependent methyltransferase [Dunaliella salina]